MMYILDNIPQNKADKRQKQQIKPFIIHNADENRIIVLGSRKR